MKSVVNDSMIDCTLSLPSWERGLKLAPTSDVLPNVWVAPLVGAWIEIVGLIRSGRFTESLPSWERGLKCTKRDTTEDTQVSLPSWERGLKLD